MMQSQVEVLQRWLWYAFIYFTTVVLLDKEYEGGWKFKENFHLQERVAL
jgi:hypothetical protein